MNEFQKFLAKEHPMILDARRVSQHISRQIDENRNISRRIAKMELTILDLRMRLNAICNVLHLEVKDD